jgi:hypothetical protein
MEIGIKSFLDLSTAAWAAEKAALVYSEFFFAKLKASVAVWNWFFIYSSVLELVCFAFWAVSISFLHFSKISEAEWYLLSAWL